jgi:hypothetical protein
MSRRAEEVIRRCIYCGEEKVMSAEHYLPECLGRFENFETLDDRVCRDCNNRCGRELEDQLCRAGELGFARYALGLQGKKNKEDVNPFKRGSSGSSPLEMKGRISERDPEIRLQLVKGNSDIYTVGIDYLTQIILIMESGEVHHIIIPDDMTEPEPFEEKVKALNLNEKIKEVRLIASEGEQERLDKLSSVLPIEQNVVWEPLPTGEKIQTTTQYEITDRYFRAIAKIGFHYLLKYLPFRGDEPIFGGIRRFIMEGGNIAEFVTWNRDQIIEQVKAGYVPTTYCHLIIAKANERRIWCHLQFFLGPNSIPYVFTVEIAKNDSALHYFFASGHQYCLYPDGLREGRNGIMENLIAIHAPR